MVRKEGPVDSRGQLRLLIVEDHAEARDAMRELLEESGHEVAEAATGREAEAAVTEFDPEGVLLDLRLGDESGFDVARALTNARPDLAVLITSVDQDDVSSERLRACGARGFVSKYRLHAVDLPALFER
jgi:DNA-binding NarL/FixJ family response regulator